MKPGKKTNRVKRSPKKQKYTKTWLESVKLEDASLLAGSDGSGIIAQIGDQYFSSFNTNPTFDPGDMMVVPKGIGEIDLNFSFGGNCEWTITRKPGDYFTSAAPDLEPDEEDSSYAYLDSWAEGAFQIKLVSDDMPELEFYLNIVFVRAVLQNKTGAISTNNSFSKTNFIGQFYINTTSDSINFSNSGASTFRVILQGGGSDAKLGVDRITCGWLQNLTDMEVYANYSDGGQEYWDPNTSLPCLDAAGPTIDGGTSAFGSDSHFVEDPGAAIGKSFKVYSDDTPQASFNLSYPGSGATPSSTHDGYSFETYLACFSSDFDWSYVLLGEVDWDILYDGKFDGSGAWSASGADVSAPSDIDDDPSTFPCNADDIGVAYWAPVIRSVMQLRHSP